MSTYKKQLEEKLFKSDWEIIKVANGEDWWIDEFWEIKLIRTNLNIVLYIVFKVDPLFEGTRKKGQGIWEIEALTQLSTTWNDKEFSIASITMSKRKYNIKLKEFINTLNKYKRTC